jgi:hypothetical protein
MLIIRIPLTLTTPTNLPDRDSTVTERIQG